MRKAGKSFACMVTDSGKEIFSMNNFFDFCITEIMFMRLTLKPFAVFFAMFIAFQSFTQSRLPSFDRALISNGFNYSNAFIKIDDKPATYDELLKASDSPYLKVEIYDAKTAKKLFGKDEGRNGVVLLTTKKYVPLNYPVFATADSAKYYVTGTDTVFTKPTVHSYFAGDTSNKTWRMFLIKNLVSQAPADNGAPSGVYVVTAHFIVNTDGSLSDIGIDDDPGYGTGNEVLRLLSKSPAWSAALYNGRPVKSFQKQNISFAVSAF